MRLALNLDGKLRAGTLRRALRGSQTLLRLT